MDIVAVGAAINAVIDLSKKAYDAAKSIKDAELQMMIADLMGIAAQLKVEMARVNEENAQLRNDLSDLKKAADMRSKVELRADHAYWFKVPEAGYNNGPFCSLCFDEDGLLITAQSSRNGLETPWCPRCNMRMRGR